MEHLRASATSHGRRDPPEYQADVGGAFARYGLMVVATGRAQSAQKPCLPPR